METKKTGKTVKRVWCCAWGIIKPEATKPSSSEATQDTKQSAIKLKPKEFVITGGIEPELNIVYISTGQDNVFPLEHSHPLPGMGIHQVSISPDSNCIAAVSINGNLTLLDLKDGVRLPRIGHTLVSNFWSSAFSGSNECVYAGTGNGSIYKYDTSVGQLEHSYNTLQCETILGLAIANDQTMLGTSDYGGNFTLFDGVTGQIFHRWDYKKPLRRLVFDPSVRIAIAACDDKTIKVIDTPSGFLRGSLPGHDAKVMSVAVSSDGQRFVSGGSDGSVKIWDARTLKSTLNFVCGGNANLWDVAFNNLNNKISFVGDGKGLNIYYCMGNKEMMLL